MPALLETTALGTFVTSMDEVVAAVEDPHVVAARAADLLAPALEDDALLAAAHQEPFDDRYRQHVVRVHPEGRYSIVALVWRPGHATPVHDHRCWCVVGVWRGVERETTYDLQSADGREWLAVRETTICRPGDVSALVPPDEDIHLVENAGDQLAISVHVYGANIAVLGSSINETFELPVLERAPARPIAWRATRPALS
jgi:predicted metal-dependent enzyme (double-stranded beta helix superfamily)